MRTSRRPTANGTVTLAQAVAQLVQNEATLLSLTTEMKIEMLAIREELQEIKAILNELPSAVKREIGFKSR